MMIDALIGRVKELIDKGKPKHAYKLLSNLEFSSQALSKNHEYWHWKGMSCHIWDLIKAISSFEKATELCPEFVPSIVEKGRCLLFLERWEEALELFTSATNLEPENPILWSGKACALGMLRRKNEQLEAIDKAITLAQGDDKIFRQQKQFALEGNSPGTEVG